MSSMDEMTQLAVTIAEHLKGLGIEVVLVGGLAVSCYTDNKFLTKDIDLVDMTYSKPKAIHQAMEQLGFCKKGRHFVGKNTDIVVEFPSAPLAVGDEIILEYDTISTTSGTLPIIKAEDLIKDRLSAYFHWKDLQSLAQGQGIMLIHGIEPSTLKDFILRESTHAEYDKIGALYSSLKETGDFDAMAISNHIEIEYLRRI